MKRRIVEIEEPLVPKILPPEREPVCRVGLVLEQDNKNEIEIVLSKGEYIIEENKSQKLFKNKKAKHLIFSVVDDTILCKELSGKEVLKSNSFVKVRKSEGKKIIEPKSGILIKGVVAGRGFHWQKEVDLFFSGELEFHQRNAKLIVVNEIPLEDYLICVVTSEMSSECPPEFLKAQATAARSWMVVFLKEKHRGVPYSICNDDCCQRYQGTTHLSKGVAEIVGQSKGVYIITEEGYVCASYYSKSCGGIIEKASNIFGEGSIGFSDSIDAPENSQTERFNPVTEKNIREWVNGDWISRSDGFCSPQTCPEESLPRYLGAVDVAGRYYRWKEVYTQNEMVELLKNKAKIDDIDEFLGFRPILRGNSGRLHELEILYRTLDGKDKSLRICSQYEIRFALHTKFLFSSAFIWDFEKDKNGKIKKITLQGAGWGHGSGLCQIGALGMALKKYSYEEILKHYFNKTTLKKIY